jgi:hypothetical protein
MAAVAPALASSRRRSGSSQRPAFHKLMAVWVPTFVGMTEVMAGPPKQERPPSRAAFSKLNKSLKPLRPEAGATTVARGEPRPVGVRPVDRLVGRNSARERHRKLRETDWGDGARAPPRTSPSLPAGSRNGSRKRQSKTIANRIRRRGSVPSVPDRAHRREPGHASETPSTCCGRR